MLGFESYSPLAWMEGIFSVHVRQDRSRTSPSSKGRHRSGIWSVPSVGRAALVASLAGAVSASHAVTPAAWVSEPTQLFSAKSTPLVSEWAPPGYIEALTLALRHAERVPAPSLGTDPAFQF